MSYGKLNTSTSTIENTVICLKSNSYLLTEYGTVEPKLRELIFDKSRVRGEVVHMRDDRDFKLLGVMKEKFAKGRVMRRLKRFTCTCGSIYETNQEKPSCALESCNGYGVVSESDTRLLVQSQVPIEAPTSKYSSKTVLYVQDEALGVSVAEQLKGAIHVSRCNGSILQATNKSDFVVTNLVNHLGLPAANRLVLDFGRQHWKKGYQKKLESEDNVYSRHSADLAYEKFLDEIEGAKIIEVDEPHLATVVGDVMGATQKVKKIFPIVIMSPKEELEPLKPYMSDYDASEVVVNKSDMISSKRKIILADVDVVEPWISPYIIAKNGKRYNSLSTSKPMSDNLNNLLGMIESWASLDKCKNCTTIVETRTNINVRDFTLPIVQSYGADLSLGAGFAKLSLSRYPRNFREQFNRVQVGQCLQVPTVSGTTDYFLVTKVKSYTPSSLLGDITNALRDFNNKCKVQEVRMPKIECGLNGHSWPKIESLIKKRVYDKTITVHGNTENRRRWTRRYDTHYSIISGNVKMEPQHVTNTTYSKWRDYDINLRGVDPRLVVRAVLEGVFDESIMSCDVSTIRKGYSGILLKKSQTTGGADIKWMKGDEDSYFYCIGVDKNGALVNGLIRSSYLYVVEVYSSPDRGAVGGEVQTGLVKQVVDGVSQALSALNLGSYSAGTSSGAIKRNRRRSSSRS